jgi:inosose dehydratase
MKLAAAPISWGVCEVPDWGLQLAPDRVLADVRALGVHATEAGPPGFLPADSTAARALLDSCGLRLIGGFVTAVLHDSGRRADELIYRTTRFAVTKETALDLPAQVAAAR